MATPSSQVPETTVTISQFDLETHRQSRISGCKLGSRFRLTAPCSLSFFTSSFKGVLLLFQGWSLHRCSCCSTENKSHFCFCCVLGFKSAAARKAQEKKSCLSPLWWRRGSVSLTCEVFLSAPALCCRRGWPRWCTPASAETRPWCRCCWTREPILTARSVLIDCCYFGFWTLG